MIRHRLPVRVAVFCSAALLTATAWADRLPSAIKSSQTPAPYTKQIQTLIDGQVKDLVSEDPVAAQLARNTLVYEVQNHTGSKESPQYQTLYAADLAKAVGPILSDAKTSLRAKINIGVVIHDVASRAYRNGGDDSALAGVVQQLLKDKQQAVVLWGLKSAKYILASIAENGANVQSLTNISKLISSTVVQNSDWGPAVEEGYAALMLQGGEFTRLKQNAQFGQMIAPTIPDLLALVESRDAKFRAANGQIPSPQAESGLGTYLAVTAFNGVVANNQVRDRALKALGQMTCDMLQAAANGNGTPEMFALIRQLGDAFQVLGGPGNLANPPLAAAGKNIAGISINNPNLNAFPGLCTGLADSLKGMGVTINPSGSSDAAEPSTPAIAGTPK